MQTRTFVATSRETLAEWLSDWLKETKAVRKASTFEGYQRHVSKWIVPTIGRSQLTSLAPEQIAALHSRLLAAGLSAGSVRRVHATLSRALSVAMRRGKLSRNPATLVDLPWHRTPEMKTWSPDELNRFLGHVAARDEALYPFWRFAAMSGARRGEVAAIGWSDIDWDRTRITIAQSAVPVGGAMIIDTTKTERVRVVDVDAATLAAFKAHRARQAELRLRFGEGYRDDLDLVFARPDGSPIDTSHLSRKFAEHARSAGLPPIRLHDLRHSAATTLFNLGYPIKVVQERLGHASASTTLNTYAHAQPSTHRAAADEMARLVDGGTAGGR